MKKLFISAIVSLVSIAPLFADAKIVIEGSTTVLPIAQRAAEDFMNAHKDAQLTVRGGGSGVGITSLLEKTCDIADSSRPIKDAEIQKAASNGVAPKAYVIAMDGIAVIVHPSNGIKNMTKQQIQDIFTGKISDWKQLAMPAQQIVVVSRDSASGTFEAFGALALDGNKVRADALLQASNQAVASVVAKTPGAIGYIGLGYITGAVKAVSVNGIAATKQTVLAGKYPFSRPLFMYTNGPAKGTAKDFITFILSKDGQKLVEEEGFVALK
ncbi:MAG: PstS family phosphate ABC transporter substrate-binding protein [Endomicrobiales bacterium]|jgi:phosphate transport system substrate-binding protein